MSETIYPLNAVEEIAYRGGKSFSLRPRSKARKNLKNAYLVTLRERDLKLARLLAAEGYSRYYTCPVALAIRRKSGNPAAVGGADDIWLRSISESLRRYGRGGEG